MTHLSVNINKIALLRNSRHVGYPDLTKLGRIALQTGAAGLTVHPRPDERHIRADDVAPAADLVRQFSPAEFNIEGNPFEGRFLEHCRTLRPTQCTLVPDDPNQSTSDHGWIFTGTAGAATFARVMPIVRELQAMGSRVSLFVDADPEQVEEAARTGAKRIELYTEPYASAFAGGDFKSVLSQFVDAAKRATDLGLVINAGHDLTLANLGVLLDAIPKIAEVSIGHALVSDALELGLAESVRRYRAICDQTRSPR